MKTISICNSAELSVSDMILIVHLKRWSGTFQRFCREDIYHNPSNSSSLIMIQLWIHSDSTSSSFLDPSRLHRLEQCDWLIQSVCHFSDVFKSESHKTCHENVANIFHVKINWKNKDICIFFIHFIHYFIITLCFLT